MLCEISLVFSDKMLIIKHRVNTIQELEATPTTFGVEVDVRYEGDRLILHHDPFVKGEDFEQYLSKYKHKLLVLNIKSEGIEQKAVQLVEKYGIKEYFLLDVSLPFVYKMTNDGFRNLAVRFSEYEPIQSSMVFAGKADWLFIDCPTKMPITKSIYSKIKGNFKTCLVSPELWGKPEKTKFFRKKIEKYGITLDAVLTKKPELWTP